MNFKKNQANNHKKSENTLAFSLFETLPFYSKTESALNFISAKTLEL